MSIERFNTNFASQQLDFAASANEFANVDSLKNAAESGDQAALEKAAKSFEAIFVRMMLKSMRQAQEVLEDENSPMNSQYMKFYRDMHDQELANDLSSKDGLGLAEIIVQQLGQQQKGYTPASLLRNDANLPFIENAPVTKKAGFTDQSAFVTALDPVVKPIAKELGIDANALIAQAALETGWGQYMVHDPLGQSSNNLFGIKADAEWQGQKAKVPTLEYQNGIAEKHHAEFKVYDSLASSVKDYASLLSKSRYAEALSVASKPQQFFTKLQEAGYATDPDYADKVMAIMQRLGE